MNKKCYIAGKIGDLPEAEYKKNFEDAKAEVAALGYEPVSPVDLPHIHGRSWSDYMREDLINMLQCGHLYALRNWRQSPGATIEISTALSIGVHIIHQPPIVSVNNTIETYRRTVLDVNRFDWPMWVVAISNSLAAREWIAYDGCPEFAKAAFEELKKEPVKVSMADEPK